MKNYVQNEYILFLLFAKLIMLSDLERYCRRILMCLFGRKTKTKKLWLLAKVRRENRKWTINWKWSPLRTTKYANVDRGCLLIEAYVFILSKHLTTPQDDQRGKQQQKTMCRSIHWIYIDPHSYVLCVVDVRRRFFFAK